ncbi:RNA exonuclease 1 [Dendrobium catenatum]|uniref:RNA exonuclease 1 n=1 Tax=Dendrobium catenatum TaxID=906689 RepID=A0A2I0XIG5_9ASPA|nr:RNA exonuclease 1 [Dendrobium catenatum]
MAWSGGPWFFFGKPFILQKWSPDFIPKREDFASIPLWIKIKNLPLSCWTPEGISKIASCVGIPLAVDALTAAKTRLTFARVCVQVSCSNPLPDEIYISVDGKITPLSVLYDWKPSPCSFCGSIYHSPDQCSKNPNPQPPPTLSQRARGRSSSRKPKQSQPPPTAILKKPLLPPSTISHDPPMLPSNASCSSLQIPNLNSPPGDLGLVDIPPPSVGQPQPILPPPTLLPINNKFDLLSAHAEETPESDPDLQNSSLQTTIPTNTTLQTSSTTLPHPTSSSLIPSVLLDDPSPQIHQKDSSATPFENSPSTSNSSFSTGSIKEIPSPKNTRSKNAKKAGNSKSKHK